MAKPTGFGGRIKKRLKDDSEVSDDGYRVEGEDLPRQKNSRGSTGLEGELRSPRQAPDEVIH